ncbi:hypothetical protein INT45_000371 [Circinella minor]|uniref:JmjC domain-containing histone demethylation protein 1 n=1 Tax=Circinella minor TaxID=1195481 RepID=A0A8H7RV84_9FUNG|nr:hypothetical protein INT45_000371 [Circinella minor]
MEQNSEKCPLCITATATTTKNQDNGLYDTWLQCDGCSTWYHAYCVNISKEQCDLIERYHCTLCIPTHGPSTYKPKRRKSEREHTRLNYADLNEGKTADQKIWSKILRAKGFAKDPFKRYQGHQVTIDLLKETGMREPFVIEQPDGLDMQMPSSTTTISDIANAVGHNHPVEVIDVATQSESTGWDMGRWSEYYQSNERDRIRNVISLEISDTSFAKDIIRPKIVRDIDWIDHMWPKELKPVEYPKVQLYCLMGTKDSYTDFHIDFGGSSVFYHIFQGSKIFYFIEPTSKNLKKYQKWSSSPDQSITFFGDEVKECFSVHLKAGNTMIIPTGWIHAVYTPEDALVIGGNFLHGFNIGTQVRIFDIEELTNVPMKFRFPFYKRINWYAALRYHDQLNQDNNEKSLFTYYELESIALLAYWLRKEYMKIEDKSKNIQSIDIPSEVNDPKGLLTDILTGVEKELKQANNNNEVDMNLFKNKLNFGKSEKKKKKKEKKQKNSSSVHNTPRIVLKLNTPSPSIPEPITRNNNNDYDDDGDDDDLIINNNYEDDDEYGSIEEEEEEGITDDEEISKEDLEIMDSDDEEYQEQQVQRKKSTISRNNNRKRSRTLSNSNNDSDNNNNNSSSSSDDDLGTSKRKNKNMNNYKRTTFESTRSSSSKKQSTVKQRLLERVSKRL